MDEIVKSWRTTMAGIAILAIAAALLLRIITLREFLAAFASLTALGLGLARDAQ